MIIPPELLGIEANHIVIVETILYIHIRMFRTKRGEDLICIDRLLDKPHHRGLPYNRNLRLQLVSELVVCHSYTSM